MLAACPKWRRPIARSLATGTRPVWGGLRVRTTLLHQRICLCNNNRCICICYRKWSTDGLRCNFQFKQEDLLILPIWRLHCWPWSRQAETVCVPSTVVHAEWSDGGEGEQVPLEAAAVADLISLLWLLAIMSRFHLVYWPTLYLSVNNIYDTK